tara:strand:- start:2565 stop:3533 length:969 start_codon:yes stop_codon:yes gene_type:complete
LKNFLKGPMNNLCDDISINKKLNLIVQNNLVSNAYIFYGPENIGKKKTAMKFISEIIQQNNGDFNALSKIKNNNHPDYVMIEPTYLSKGNLINQSEVNSEIKIKSKAQIRIDQIRYIRNFLGQNSIESYKKFILIDDAHLLNESSSNGLLKTIEEPTNGMVILITSKIHLLINTIISRCQLIKFKPYSNRELEIILRKSEILSKDKNQTFLENIIFISNGSPGQVLENYKNWEKIPLSIKKEIKSPIYDYEKILFLAKDIANLLDLKKQEFLLDYIQYSWWKKTKNRHIVEAIESIKTNIINKIQPRLSWEIGLLQIAIRFS